MQCSRTGTVSKYTKGHGVRSILLGDGEACEQKQQANDGSGIHAQRSGSERPKPYSHSTTFAQSLQLAWGEPTASLFEEPAELDSTKALPCFLEIALALFREQQASGFKSRREAPAAGTR